MLKWNQVKKATIDPQKTLQIVFKLAILSEQYFKKHAIAYK